MHDPSLRRRIIMVFMLLIIGVMPTLAGGRRESSPSRSSPAPVNSEKWVHQRGTKVQTISTGYSVVHLTWVWTVAREVYSGRTRLEREPRVSTARVYGGNHTHVNYNIVEYLHIPHSREVHWSVVGRTWASSTYPWIPRSMTFGASDMIRY